MNCESIKEILSGIKRAKIAVYGDFCLDAYWVVDPRASEISVETGLRTQGIQKQNYSLGGAANIVANVAALEPAEIQAIGVVGDDIFGRELTRQLQALAVETTGLIKEKDNFDTITYCKRYLDGKEQHRIDFGFSNQRSEATESKLIQRFQHAFKTADVIIINQQVPGSLPNQSFFDNVNELIQAYPDKIVLLDSRHYAGKFKNVILKTNDVEAALLSGREASPEDIFNTEDVIHFAEEILSENNLAVIITRGVKGIFVSDGNGLHEIPGIQLMKQLDTVGAGDTTVSALACCLATGASVVDSARIANFAAAVTVQKLFQTGTASGKEILGIAAEHDYLYQPELALDSRLANYHGNSEIEICCDLKALTFGRIKHAVFDHDGTISTLRQGWEDVMERMMIKAILGKAFESVDSAQYQKVRLSVLEFIDNSTGLQTILQMGALVEMVKEFGFVPKDKVLDKFGYKDIFNQDLMRMVNQRIAKLKNKELEVDDFTVKGAVSFLKMLRDKNVTLYLVSGTDSDDVINEAQILGYAYLFDGGIYGSVGDVKKYSKKIVIENIIRKNKLQGSELACFGDGPVEIRRCRNSEGIAVGIASDEIRRYGLNPEKRTRLIKSGAQFVMPDFLQAKELLDILFKGAPYTSK